MADDLFASAAAERLESRAPLADRMRPTSLDEVVGQGHLLDDGAPLRRLIEADRLSSAILWGPAGTGKTTLARLVARTTAKEFASLSAVDASVKDVRQVLARARQLLGEREQGTILFLDEVHRFSKSQQDALLPAVEEGLVVLIGATTENPHFTVNPPLLSRSTMFRLEPLDADALRELVARGLEVEEADRRPRGRRPPGPAGRRRRPPDPDRPGGGGGPRRRTGPRRRRRARPRCRWPTWRPPWA